MPLNKELTDTVSAICRLPSTAREIQTKSIYHLLKESGYRQFRDQITPNVLVECLRRERHLINDWMLYSEDKRTGSGWYFEVSGEDRYVVGYYPKGPEMSFSDPALACAEFIAREVNQIDPRFGFLLDPLIIPLARLYWWWLKYR